MLGILLLNGVKDCYTDILFQPERNCMADWIALRVWNGGFLIRNAVRKPEIGLEDMLRMGKA